MEFFKVYFKRVPSKGYYVACEVAKRAYKHNILENMFPDDDSENHEVLFSKDQWHDFELMFRCLIVNPHGESVPGMHIFNVDIRRVEGYCEYDGNIHLHNIRSKGVPKFINKECQYTAHFWGNQTKINLTPNAEENAREVIEILKQRMNFSNDSQLAEYIRHKYMLPMEEEHRKCAEFLSKCNYKRNIEIMKHQGYKVANELSDSDYKIFNEISRERRNTVKEEFDAIYEGLVREGKLPIKWKSEFELFELVKKYFEDAKFQYSPKWLFPQRYDVFIPSINTAIEYQGIQHFQAIDFFGGEEGYIKRVELDKVKKAKSYEHGTKLIEWLYDEPMSKAVLTRKLDE